MSMYYFSLHDNADVTDFDGTDLPDLNAAREHAIAVARELMFKRHGMLDREWAQWTMSVRDDAGQEVLSFVLPDVDDIASK